MALSKAQRLQLEEWVADILREAVRPVTAGEIRRIIASSQRLNPVEVPQFQVRTEMVTYILQGNPQAVLLPSDDVRPHIAHRYAYKANVARFKKRAVSPEGKQPP